MSLKLVDKIGTSQPDKRKVRVALMKIQELRPLEDVTIKIVPTCSDTDHLNNYVVFGEVLDDEMNTIYLFEEAITYPARNNCNKMPMAERVPMIEYIVAHEYGHVHAGRVDKNLLKRYFRKAWEISLSKQWLPLYARSSVSEGYAEAFAEWHLSHGSSENKAAQLYAELFNWTL